MAAKVQALGEESSVQRRANRTELMQLIEKQEYRCALTGLELTPATAEIDHKVPVSRGGDHSINNLHAVHETINRMKAAMTVDEFVGWCRKVTQWNS